LFRWKRSWARWNSQKTLAGVLAASRLPGEHFAAGVNKTLHPAFQNGGTSRLLGIEEGTLVKAATSSIAWSDEHAPRRSQSRPRAVVVGTSGSLRGGDDRNAPLTACFRKGPPGAGKLVKRVAKTRRHSETGPIYAKRCRTPGPTRGVIAPSNNASLLRRIAYLVARAKATLLQRNPHTSEVDDGNRRKGRVPSASRRSTHCQRQHLRPYRPNQRSARQAAQLQSACYS